MKSYSFALQPFAGDMPLPAVAVTGQIERHGTDFSISYHLSGRLAELVIPAPAKEPARQWVLWESTCFEFFLAPQPSCHYWEFNLSPAGHWNVFRLEDYRQGLREETAFTTLPCLIQQHSDSVRLTLRLDLGPIIPADQSLEVGITAVLQHLDGRLSYWALSHPGPQPDFHRREGFVIKVS
jgi:hypothetical protein